MPTTATPRAIITAVLKGEKPKKRLKSMKWSIGSRRVFSYGQHYPLVITLWNGQSIDERDNLPRTVLVNVTPDSATTNRHIRAALEAVHELGYEEVVNRPEIIGHMTYKVFTKGR